MKPGDTVKIKTKDSEHTGLLMPNEETDAIVVKLASGYNMGIAKKNIKKSTVVKKGKIKDEHHKKISHNSKKPTIAVLHTGGTIASKVDYESGGVSAKFTAADLIELVPEVGKIANIETELVANMMSEDMFFSDHIKIASAVKKWADKGVGVIIGHGTDTLGYTAASLSFMFEKINIPVLIVGSQRSSDRGSTDAAMNLICAVRFIAKTDFTGVSTCLHHTSDDFTVAIIQGTKSRKLHTSRRDAFRAVNDTPIALVDYQTGKIKYLREYNNSGDSVVLKPKFSNDVGFLKSHPNMKTDVFDFYTKKYKAFVIEGTGLGHAPTNLGQNLKNYDMLTKFISKGGIVAMTSQCVYGRVHPAVYANLRRLSSIGVIYCEDMLPETAYVKLSWLMGNYPAGKVKELMTENLRGEITKRTMPDEFIE